MNRWLARFAIVRAVTLVPTFGKAQNLLLNGNLNSVTQVGSIDLYYAEPTSWTITTDPCSYSPCAIIPYVQGQLYTQFPGRAVDFAERKTPDDHVFNPVTMMDEQLPGFRGLLGNASEGHFPGEIIGPVDVEIKQAVPGVAGQIYALSGWAHFEGGYAGGVEFLELSSPNPRNLAAQAVNPGVPLASLTDTFFNLEFLDSMGTVLPGSISDVLGPAFDYELHVDGGQQNDPNQTPTSRVWVQHRLKATAPPGTVSVQVRAAMVNGEFNLDIPGGSMNVFFDDFELHVVPEPASGLMALLGLVLAGGVRRRN